MDLAAIAYAFNHNSDSVFLIQAFFCNGAGFFNRNITEVTECLQEVLLSFEF